MREKFFLEFGIIFMMISISGLPSHFSYAYTEKGVMKEIHELETAGKPDSQDGHSAAQKILRPIVKYDAGKFKDPFQKPIIERKGMPEPEEAILAKAAAPHPSLSIEGVIWGGSIPQAIINHTVVRIGDEIGGVRVVSINREGVTFSSSGEEFTVPSPFKTISLYTNRGG